MTTLFGGETLREWRERRGWTQRQLADATGTPQASISYYERGRAPAPAALRDALWSKYQFQPVEVVREKKRERNACAVVDRWVVGAMLLAAVKKARLEEEGGTELRGMREQCAACAATVVWYDGHGWPWERREGVAR